MTTNHPESRLLFTFSDDWRVIKWDEHTAFRQGLCLFGGTKAVDFIGIMFDTPWLIEVKNFRGYRIQNKQRLSSGELAKEIANKIRDSIASITWACKRVSLDKHDLAPFARAIFAHNERISVVLWLEEDREPMPAQASALAAAIKRELTWLNPKVLVMSRALAESKPLRGVVVIAAGAPPAK